MSNQAITKRMLGRALQQLMSNRPIEKISVQQICDTCGVHRKTFYYHFANKYELLNWVFYSECIEPILKNPPDDIRAALTDIVYCVDSKRGFYTNAFRMAPETNFGNTVANSFQEYFIEQIKLMLNTYTDPEFPPPKQVDPEEYRSYFADTLAGSFMGNVQQWLLENPRLTAEQYLELLNTVILEKFHIVQEESKA